MPVAVVLLAAGYATRLAPLTDDRPKALLPLGDGVILDAVARSLNDVPERSACLLVTNHRFAEQFDGWRRAQEVPVEIIDDGTMQPEERLGAIRDLDLAQQRVPPDDDLLVVGTDNLFPWSLGAFVASAQRHRPHPTLALWAAPSAQAATQFGVVVRDRTGRLTSFVEKSAQPPSTDVALCVYYFPAAMRGMIQRFLAQGGQGDAPGYFIAWLVKRGPVYGIMMRGSWYDIGTLDAYHTVVREWKSGGSDQ